MVDLLKFTSNKKILNKIYSVPIEFWNYCNQTTADAHSILIITSVCLVLRNMNN